MRFNCLKKGLISEAAPPKGGFVSQVGHLDGSTQGPSCCWHYCFNERWGFTLPQIAAQGCCEEVCACTAGTELAGDGGLQPGCGGNCWHHCLPCQNKDHLKSMRPAAAQVQAFIVTDPPPPPPQVRMEIILVFASRFFKSILMDILNSVRLPYLSLQCTLWQWLNGMNRRNISQLPDLYCMLLSLCGAKGIKIMKYHATHVASFQWYH